MSATAAPEVTRFLHAHPPFDALDDDEIERVAAAAEIEFHRAGATIFSQGAEPVDHLRIIRAGAVEIVFDGRMLDLLGEGDLFGHASMLSGLPTGFEARAGEDTVCYRIPAEVAQESLSRPAGLRFVARSLLDIRITTRPWRRGRHRARRRSAVATGGVAAARRAGRVRPGHDHPRGGGADDRGP